ncbi:recombinase family protein [Liquorilactobacillus nagelii]|uniref:recombinase family protein n=1 Tax=Liquorilactobacillus nagelii TaxID=82688 RepID=UPI0039E9FC17
MTKIGYARVSTRDQNLARQLEQLKSAGVTKIFQEKISGKDSDRPQLQKMLNYLRDDDEVIVVSLDRLGRNSKDLTDIIEAIRHQGATLNVLNLPSFAGIEDPNLRNLITNIIVELYKYIAQEERETIRERQRQGIEIAKKQGKYKGKVREYGPDSPNRQKRYIYKEACKLLDQKKAGNADLTKRQIARMLGIAPVTLYRIEKYHAEEKNQQER